MNARQALMLYPLCEPPLVQKNLQGFGGQCKADGKRNYDKSRIGGAPSLKKRGTSNPG